MRLITAGERYVVPNVPSLYFGFSDEDIDEDALQERDALKSARREECPEGAHRGEQSNGYCFRGLIDCREMLGLYYAPSFSRFSGVCSSAYRRLRHAIRYICTSEKCTVHTSNRSMDNRSIFELDSNRFIVQFHQEPMSIQFSKL